jgi:GTP-binding protein
VVDTGGLVAGGDELAALMRRQVELAVDEADVVLMLVEGPTGLTADDHEVARRVRRSGKPVVLAVNKSEGRPAEEAAAEFHALGFADVMAISSGHGEGVQALAMRAIELCPPRELAAEAEPESAGVRIAIVGRPNVGKSTLINRYLHEDRVVTRDEPGTTRDSIRIPFSLEGRRYTLIDTAGIRRRARVENVIEKFSVAKALQAVDESDAVIVLLDAREGVSEQDVSLIGLVLERGRALTVGLNKWDGLSSGQRHVVMQAIARQLPFLEFAEVHPISALHGSNIFELFASAVRAAEAAASELPTTELNRVLQDFVAVHPPPLVRGRRIRLTYAHQGGRRPPLIVVHGNQTAHLPDAYRRYLVNRFREAFRLTGTPVRLELRTGRNPYAGRRNPLTPRQVRKRRRIRKR